MLEQLKRQVYEANMMLPKHHMVTFTWGNVSGIDREAKLFVIKPSGVVYEQLKPDDMVVMDLSGKQVEGSLKPSSDTPTHTELYNQFPQIGGVVHTHSPWATSWAQAGRNIPMYGTTQADYFHGSVPCTRVLRRDEVASAYELNTGKLIAEHFTLHKINPVHVPAVLVYSHGPFAWGHNCFEAVYHAIVVENVAKMAFYTEALREGPETPPMEPYILDKHFYRKHGPDAYYGQKTKE